MWFLFVVLGLMSLYWVVNLPKKLRSIRFANASASALAKTPWLAADTPVGSAVKVAGIVRHPAGRTPYGNLAASYWLSEVRAVFQTKAKKPASGMVTNTPVLEKKSLEDQPIVMQTSEGNVVQVHMAQPDRSIRDLQEAKLELNSIPEGLRHLDQPKYDRYQVVERYLPPQAQVFAYGRVLDRNGACTTIGDPVIGPMRGMLTTASESSLLDQSQQAVRQAKRRIVILFVVCALGWWGLYHVAF